MTLSFILTSLLYLNSEWVQAKAQDFAAMSSWGYQLNNYCSDKKGWKFDKNDKVIDVVVDCKEKANSFDLISATQNTLWVIDPTLIKISDTEGEGASGFEKEINWTVEQIKAMKANNNMLIAYINIGQASAEENYFKELNKTLLGAPDKEFKGDFDVNYWVEDWQKVFLTEGGPLDRIMNQGFDGVFLDQVGRFESFPDNEKKSKAKQMADFIIKISLYTKAKKSDFKIIIQNGLGFATASSQGGPLADPFAELYRYVDAQAVESLFFDGSTKAMKRNDQEEMEQVRLITEVYDLPVFNVEYIYREDSDQNYALSKESYFRSLQANFGVNNKIYPLFASPNNTRDLNGAMERVSVPIPAQVAPDK